MGKPTQDVAAPLHGWGPGLNRQQAPEVCLSLLPSCWDHSHVPPSLAFSQGSNLPLCVCIASAFLSPISSSFQDYVIWFSLFCCYFGFETESREVVKALADL